MIDDLLNQLSQAGGIWLIISLVAAMIVMQGVKAVLKQVWPGKWVKRYRTWLIFVIAYGVGYQLGIHLITGDEAEKWAYVVGLVNPFLYFFLLQYAIANNRMVLLSMLKMRQLERREDGTIRLHETQTFMAGKK